MPRTKSIAAARHRKTIKQAKGFKHAAGKRVRAAKEAILHAGKYAYVGRKLRKRDMRALWILRLNAATREYGVPYNKFISGLKKANIEIDRKILSDIAIHDKEAFKAIVEQASKTTAK